MTPVGWPSVSDARKVGATAQAKAAVLRRSGRSVTRVAANQPPSAASGSARTHRTTIAREGDAGDRLPRSATTAANGSAGPTVSHPTARAP